MPVARVATKGMREGVCGTVTLVKARSNPLQPGVRAARPFFSTLCSSVCTGGRLFFSFPRFSSCHIFGGTLPGFREDSHPGYASSNRPSGVPLPSPDAARPITAVGLPFARFHAPPTVPHIISFDVSSRQTRSEFATAPSEFCATVGCQGIC